MVKELYLSLDLPLDVTSKHMHKKKPVEYNWFILEASLLDGGDVLYR